MNLRSVAGHLASLVGRPTPRTGRDRRRGPGRPAPARFASMSWDDRVLLAPAAEAEGPWQLATLLMLASVLATLGTLLVN